MFRVILLLLSFIGTFAFTCAYSIEPFSSSSSSSSSSTKIKVFSSSSKSLEKSGAYKNKQFSDISLRIDEMIDGKIYVESSDESDKEYNVIMVVENHSNSKISVQYKIIFENTDGKHIIKNIGTIDIANGEQQKINLSKLLTEKELYNIKYKIQIKATKI